MRCNGILFDCTSKARSRGGKGMLDNNNPALFIIRMVDCDPNPVDAPPVAKGTVTAAIGPPLGHPATNVVVVVDSNLANSVLSPVAPRTEFW
mmetsp:Transcript_17842/g.32418  ORF Transcript_17842/g.32418 Transcript_17842/m.32418 type:complete len:92 (+) Transcript_17842:109-384(+)